MEFANNIVFDFIYFWAQKKRGTFNCITLKGTAKYLQIDKLKPTP